MLPNVWRLAPTLNGVRAILRCARFGLVSSPESAASPPTGLEANGLAVGFPAVLAPPAALPSPALKLSTLRAGRLGEAKPKPELLASDEDAGNRCPAGDSGGGDAQPSSSERSSRL